ncbi:MAG: glycosyltransferase, partial [Tepidisphaeraceae bacterium]
CAHNAAARLPAALNALAQMENMPGAWECLVVDNASTDDTRKVAEDAGRRLALPLRVVSEPIAGHTRARARAAAEARGELLSFIDDDNLVSPQWAQNCIAFFAAHPSAGIAGGKIAPVFEDPASIPPDFQEHYAQALAIRDMGEAERKLILLEDDPPCGAGMTGRTALFRRILLDIGCHLTGRTGGALTSGDDTEIGLLAQRLGWETWYTPSLQMAHVLPARRLRREYLDAVIATGAFSTPWLDCLRNKEPHRSRASNVLIGARWRLAAAKIKFVGKLKGPNHPDAGRFPFWYDLFRNRAAGYFDLARNDPAGKLAAGLAKLNAQHKL